MSNLIGQVLGGAYKVERQIGEGGMGAVYEVSNVRLGKRFAVKILSKLAQSNSTIVHRFRREALVTSDLGHSHIIEVHDFNEMEDGTPYMVMEYLVGEDLQALLNSSPQLPLPRAVFIMRQVCSALQAAHDNGVIHRDLKPANIFRCVDKEYEDFVKVLDFGVSKVLGSTSMMTAESAIFGTPDFMAPEQAEAENQRVCPATDVFAAGSILYYMITGTLPFDADSVPAVLYRIVHQEPKPVQEVRPEVPEALARAIDRAMAKEPEARYPTVRAFSKDLSQAVPAATGAPAGWTWESRSSSAFTGRSRAVPEDVGLAATVADTRDESPAAGGPRSDGPGPTTLSGAATELEPRAATEPPRATTHGSRRPWVLGIGSVMALGLATLLVVFLTRPEEQVVRPPPGLSGAVRAPAKEPATPKPRTEPAKRRIEIKVAGTPVGARILDVKAGVVLATVPGSFIWPRSDEGSLEIRAVFRGHEPQEVSIPLDRDQEIAIRLKPQRHRPRRPARKKPVSAEKPPGESEKPTKKLEVKPVEDLGDGTAKF